jgi:hypothetical protein
VPVPRKMNSMSAGEVMVVAAVVVVVEEVAAEEKEVVVGRVMLMKDLVDAVPLA